MSLESLKKTIFANHKEIQKKFYDKLDKKHFSDFEFLFADEIVQKDIEILMDVIKEREIQINEQRLIEFLLKKATKKNIKVSVILEYISEEFDLSKHEEVFIEHNNGIIDIYKQDVAEGYKILTILKSIILQNKFNENFLKPLLKYLDSELEATHSIEEYSNISELFEITKKEKELKELAFKIFKKCLAKDQKIKENHMGLKLFIKITSFLNKEKLNEAKEVIDNNDNKDKWDNTIKEKLKSILGNSDV